MRRILCILALIVLPATSAFARQTVPTTAPPQTPPPARPTQSQPPTTAPPVHPGGVPVTPVQGRPGTPPPSQAPQTQQTPQAPPTQVPIRPVGPGSNRDQTSSWQNVAISVVITDTLTADKPTNKVVGMLVLDGRSGQVRSNSQNGTINVDVAPSIRPDGRIALQLTLEYLPEIGPVQGQGQPQAMNSIGRVASFNESLALIVSDGKKTMVSEASDPKSDRKVTLEITATVVK